MSESASLTESTESLDIWLWSSNILSCLIRGPDSNEHLVTLCITEMRSPAMGPMGLGDFSSGKKEKVHPDLQNTKRRLGYQVPDIYIYVYFSSSITFCTYIHLLILTILARWLEGMFSQSQQDSTLQSSTIAPICQHLWNVVAWRCIPPSPPGREMIQDVNGLNTFWSVLRLIECHRYEKAPWDGVCILTRYATLILHNIS